LTFKGATDVLTTSSEWAGILKEDPMNIWTILFVVLLVTWIGGFTILHVAGGGDFLDFALCYQSAYSLRFGS
jgi:hypothetical protein